MSSTSSITIGSYITSSGKERKYTMSVVEPHPYYPIGVQISGYNPNKYPVLTIIVYFSLILAAILGAVIACATYLRPYMSRADKLSILWFALSGTLHCFFEGYFVFHHTHMGPSQDLFGQLWKEYALSDSRYLISDPFVVTIESITVTVWGPLCFVLAYLTAVGDPLQHVVQVIVCMAHLYGDVLYYGTNLFEHYVNRVSYCRPEAIYFWGYYFFMNFIWIVVPAYYLYESVSAISSAFRALNRAADRKKSR